MQSLVLYPYLLSILLRALLDTTHELHKITCVPLRVLYILTLTYYQPTVRATYEPHKTARIQLRVLYTFTLTCYHPTVRATRRALRQISLRISR